MTPTDDVERKPEKEEEPEDSSKETVSLSSSAHTKSSKVIGIRGLNPHLYNEVSIKAKQRGITVSDLINEIFMQYINNSGNNIQVIGGLDSLELHEDELHELGGPGINFVDIGKLAFAPDVTRETFDGIKSIKRVDKILVPKNLYIPLLKKVRHSGGITKYSGQNIPRLITKFFHSDVHLSSDFFQYFIESEIKVNLSVEGDLTIDEDVTSDELKTVVNSLRVEGDIVVPRDLAGWTFAVANCEGGIEVKD